MTASTNLIELRGASSFNLTTAGKQIDAFNLLAQFGTYTLQDTFNMPNCSLSLSNGTFTANNFDVTLSSVTGLSAGGNAATLTMGSGTWTVGGSGTPWSLIASNSLNANTSTLKFTASGALIFTSADKMYYNVTYSPPSYDINSSLQINGGPAIDTLQTINASKIIFATNSG